MRYRRTRMVRGTCIFFALLVAGCSGKVSSKTLPDTDLSQVMSSDEPPPAMAFFAHPMLRSVDLSPDGVRVAGVVATGEKEMLVVRKRLGGSVYPIATMVRDARNPGMSIASIAWPSDDRLLMVVEEPITLAINHSRRSRLFSVSVQGDAKHLLEGWRGGTTIWNQGNIVSTLPQDPEHFLLSVQFLGERYPGVYRVDATTGRYSTVEPSRWGITDWHADHLGVIRAAEGAFKPRDEQRDDELLWAFLARASGDQALQPVDQTSISGGATVAFAAFAADPEFIYVILAGEGGRLGVHLLNLDTGKLEAKSYTHPVVDVSTVVSSPYDGRPLYVIYLDERPELIFLDAERKRMQERIDGALPGRFNYVIDSDRSESIFLVRSSSDVVPPEYYWFDGRELALFFSEHPELKGRRFSPMRAVRYQARDGVTIHGYLTRPADAPDGPCATIVLPHGGPFIRDVWGWDSVVQFLVSRGFAVFQPNFRGSDGYGFDFEQMGWGEWGLAMQDDITDGVKWLIEQGEADPERVGIFGISYGGYAALQGLATTPDLYKAGASLSGVTDLRLFMEKVAENLYYTDYMEKLVGNRRHDKERLKATSPVHQADRIRVPVLLGHGTADWNVDVAHTRSMARALRRSRVPTEVYLYDNEPHDFLDDRNLAHFFDKLVLFFETHLEP